MGIVSTTKGGGKFYVSPHIEVILVQAEKGFAVSDVHGASGTVNGDNDYGYDDPYANM